MSAPRKYPDELRDRATRMAVEARRDPERAKGAIRRIAGELGVYPEVLRTWVKRAEIDGGTRPGTTSADGERIRELEKEVRELRRANAILKSASAFFAAELGVNYVSRTVVSVWFRLSGCGVWVRCRLRWVCGSRSLSGGRL